MRKVSRLVTAAMVAGACLLAAAPSPASAAQLRQVRLEGVRRIPEIPYQVISGITLYMDAFIPREAGDFPALIAMHGGGFHTGTRDLMTGTCAFFAQNGYACFTIDYRLSPEFVYPAAVDDAKAAIEFVRSHAGEYQVDPERMAAVGSSAGGTLAATIAGESQGTHSTGWEVAAGVSYSGGLAFTKFVEDAVARGATPSGVDANNDIQLYVYGQETADIQGSEDGDPAIPDKEELQRADPDFKVGPTSAPMFMSHFEQDHFDTKMDEYYKATLERLGIAYEYFLAPGVGHGRGPLVHPPSLDFVNTYVRDFRPAEVTPTPSPTPSETSAPTPRSPRPARPPRGRTPVVAILLALLVLVVVAGIVVGLLVRTSRRPGREE